MTTFTEDVAALTGLLILLAIYGLLCYATREACKVVCEEEYE